MLENYQSNPMIIITDITLNKIINICKATKLSIFRVILNSDGDIVEISGMNENMNYLCIANNDIEPISYNLYNLYFKKDDIANIDKVKNIVSTEPVAIPVYQDYILEPTTGSALLINEMSFGTKFYYIKNNYDSKYLVMKELINRQYIDYGEINTDDAIIRMMTCKVADNIISYIKDGYYMNIYKGLVPVSKSDKIYLRIYPNFGNINTFVSQFIIKKKKNIILNFYYWYLYI